jgi:hypothetical protein
MCFMRNKYWILVKVLGLGRMQRKKSVGYRKIGI